MHVVISRWNRLAAVIAAVLTGSSTLLLDAAAGQEMPKRIVAAALIDIHALTAESDFTVFMHKDVPEDVRRAALRRLWVLMRLPVSCHELCDEQEPTPSGFARLASEKLPPAAQ